MLDFIDYCLKHNLDRLNRCSRSKSLRKYLKYKHFMKYRYELCVWKLFINKVNNYEHNIVSLICYLVTGSYKWKPITDTQIPLISEIFITPHISQCYAAYHGSNYFINCYNNTVGNVSCNRCKIQRDFESEYGEPIHWIMYKVTKKFKIQTNNLVEMKKLKKKWGMDDELIEIIDSPWWYKSNIYGGHIKLDFPTRYPNQQNISYLDPNRHITLGDSNTLMIDGVSYHTTKYNFSLDP